MECQKGKTWMGAILLMASAAVSAQELRIEGRFKDADAQAMNLYVDGLGDTVAAVKAEAEGSRFAAEVAAAPGGFYKLYGSHNGVQLMAPFYAPQTGKTYKLEMRMQDGCPVADGSKDNRALSAFNAFTYAQGRALWKRSREMGQDELKAFLKGFASAADSIAKRYGCSAPVKEYLDLWAYVMAYDSYSVAVRNMGQAQEKEVFPLSDVLAPAADVLNTPMASYFSAAGYIVYTLLPKGELADRLAWLYGHFSSKDFCRKVETFVFDEYVRRFDFSAGDFEAGLAALESAVAQYGSDAGYVDKFKARKSSVKGKDFPTAAELVDAEGNRMDFSRFKGSYVYIDLWASWCGPCCKEVPFLQELERTLENKNVKFLSISLDKDEKAWKNKMKALGMHGNQWLSRNEALAEALNVKGIPYFVIYDKEGKLYKGNAPRPSSPELKALLEGLR